jgi:hypothetical protein
VDPYTEVFTSLLSKLSDLWLCAQMSVAQVGVVPPPLSPTYNPASVPGELQLTQV